MLNRIKGEEKKRKKNINPFRQHIWGFFEAGCKEMQNKNVGIGLVLFNNQALQQEFVKENTYGSLPS